jgi:large subunit ribosomal protein L25
MKTLEMIGYKRANLGKSDAKKLRAEGRVPCVLYGGKEQLHFETPMINFRDLVYTSDAHFVNISVDDTKAQAILQDIQFHPVSEVIMHVDFLELTPGKTISMEIPVRTKGNAPGVAVGGKLYINQKYLLVKALPKDMPEEILIDISKLQLGSSIKVGAVETGDFEFVTSDLVSIISVETPRTIKVIEREEDEELEGEEGEEGEEGAAEGGESPAEGGEGGEDAKPAEGES